MALAPRNVLVTGSSRGIGLEFVRQLLARGDCVIATCRSPERATELSKLIQGPEADGQSHLVKLDVTDSASLDAAAKEIASKVDHLDVVINNAGIMGDVAKPLSTTREMVWSTMDTNVVAPLMVTQQLQGLLKPGAKAVYLSSFMGSITNTTESTYGAYRASRAALNMMLKALSLELAERGVGVLAINPGWVNTDLGASVGGTPPLQPAESVAGMLSVVNGFSASSPFRFCNHKGEDMAV